MANLGGPSTLSTQVNRRPFQAGRLLGTKYGAPVQAEIDWLVDTGAEIATVRQSLGTQFDTSSTGLTASPTTGGGGLQVVTGLTAEFTVEDAAQRAQRVVQSTTHVAIKSTNACRDLLGMEQVADVDADVRWDPLAGTGDLVVRSSSPSSGGAGTLPQPQVAPSSPRLVDHGTWVEVGGVGVPKADTGLDERATTAEGRERLLADLLSTVRSAIERWQRRVRPGGQTVEINHYLLVDLSDALTCAPDLAWAKVRAAFARALQLQADISTVDLEAALRRRVDEAATPLTALLRLVLDREMADTLRLCELLADRMRGGRLTFEPTSGRPGGMLGDVIV